MKRKLFLIIFITLTFFLCGLLCFQKTEQIQTKKLENENVLFSLFQGDEKVDTIPSKDSGYYFDRDKHPLGEYLFHAIDEKELQIMLKIFFSYKSSFFLYFD